MPTTLIRFDTKCQADILSLDAVMGHLAPTDDAMAAAARDAASALAKEIRGIGVSNLSSTAAAPVRKTLLHSAWITSAALNVGSYPGQGDPRHPCCR